VIKRNVFSDFWEGLISRSAKVKFLLYQYFLGSSRKKAKLLQVMDINYIKTM